MTSRTLISDPGGTTRLIKRWFASDAGGVTRFAKRVFISDPGGVARLIFATQVTGSASPTFVQASGFGPITLTTPITTVTASGGVPGYTYAWTWQSGGGGITITSPSTASTAFNAHLAAGASKNGTAMCTVTDTIGDQGFAFCSVLFSTTN
jgi:hypothetical protein